VLDIVIDIGEGFWHRVSSMASQECCVPFWTYCAETLSKGCLKSVGLDCQEVFNGWGTYSKGSEVLSMGEMKLSQSSSVCIDES